ncbi:MAG TPA: glycosyltransferase [Bacteroidota bacterium]|nr:glycosyltransferase [Bacteroidota bacterium]
MNIIILGTAYPLRGGIAHYIALLYTHLRKRHHVEVVSFKRQYPKILFPGKSQEEEGDPGLPVTSEQLMDSVNPLNWIRVGLALRRRNPDLVIFKYWLPFFGPCFGTICALIKYGRKTRVVAICDNVIPHERRPGDRLFTWYAFKFVDGYIVQSDSVEKDLVATVDNPRYKKVPHPVYEIFGARLGKKDARAALNIRDERVILFFGYIRPYKGLHVMIDAMKELKKSLRVKLLVVGEYYDDEEQYRWHISDAQVRDVVDVVSDYVPNEMVGKYFSAADAVMLPYLSATQSGIAQIAYNFDKPVIATDVGGLAEVVVDGVSGLVVPPNNPSRLAEAVLRFYNEGLEETLSAGAAREKKKYSWERMTEAIEQLTASSEQ